MIFEERIFTKTKINHGFASKILQWKKCSYDLYLGSLESIEKLSLEDVFAVLNVSPSYRLVSQLNNLYLWKTLSCLGHCDRTPHFGHNRRLMKITSYDKDKATYSNGITEIFLVM